MSMRPDSSDCSAYFYDNYVMKVPAGEILTLLAGEGERIAGLLDGISEAQSLERYAPEKWSIKEVVGHMIDTERIFAYRSLVFARGDDAVVPSFEQDDYTPAGRFDARPFDTLIDEYRAARRSHLALWSGFDAEAWASTGRTSESDFTTRVIPYIVAGHELHHGAVLSERYL
jgi:hypothetical protein